jgi:hypothetical protein
MNSVSCLHMVADNGQKVYTDLVPGGEAAGGGEQ